VDPRKLLKAVQRVIAVSIRIAAEVVIALMVLSVDLVNIRRLNGPISDTCGAPNSAPFFYIAVNYPIAQALDRARAYL
jgi:hypothetical protein